MVSSAQLTISMDGAGEKIRRLNSVRRDVKRLVFRARARVQEKQKREILNAREKPRSKDHVSRFKDSRF